MKNFKLTIFSLLITTTTAFAQIGNPDISDKWTISEYDKYEVKTEGDEKYTVKHHEITEEYTSLLKPRLESQKNKLEELISILNGRLLPYSPSIKGL